jgi:hypothetical protein
MTRSAGSKESGYSTEETRNIDRNINNDLITGPPPQLNISKK